MSDVLWYRKLGFLKLKQHLLVKTDRIVVHIHLKSEGLLLLLFFPLVLQVTLTTTHGDGLVLIDTKVGPNIILIQLIAYPWRHGT